MLWIGVGLIGFPLNRLVEDNESECSIACSVEGVLYASERVCTIFNDDKLWSLPDDAIVVWTVFPDELVMACNEGDGNTSRTTEVPISLVEVDFNDKNEESIMLETVIKVWTMVAILDVVTSASFLVVDIKENDVILIVVPGTRIDVSVFP